MTSTQGSNRFDVNSDQYDYLLLPMMYYKVIIKYILYNIIK